MQIAQKEVDSNPRASQAMREFSCIREADAETGARRVLVKHGLSAPVELSTFDLGDDRDMKKKSMVKTIQLVSTPPQHWCFAETAGWSCNIAEDERCASRVLG